MNQRNRLLLAEDEPLVAMILQDTLEEVGFSVHHALAAAEAIAALDSDHAELSGLITDIRLGGGADGWAVARHARARMPTLPILYISGDNAHDHKLKGVPDSIMLQKPFASSQLIAALSTLLNQRQQQPA
ncbi:response regulator [Allosphingosinicella deserti]|uniref:response regulator n=1 Tax=Allosphingosinicella deserti TaxID=2116704 RepID=UPI0018EC83D0|nr:response regulator [Sphingomonas deserti]